MTVVVPPEISEATDACSSLSQVWAKCRSRRRTSVLLDCALSRAVSSVRSLLILSASQDFQPNADTIRSLILPHIDIFRILIDILVWTDVAECTLYVVRHQGLESNDSRVRSRQLYAAQTMRVLMALVNFSNRLATHCAFPDLLVACIRADLMGFLNRTCISLTREMRREDSSFKRLKHIDTPYSTSHVLLVCIPTLISMYYDVIHMSTFQRLSASIATHLVRHRLLPMSARLIQWLVPNMGRDWVFRQVWHDTITLSMLLPVQQQETDEDERAIASLMTFTLQACLLHMMPCTHMRCVLHPDLEHVCIEDWDDIKTVVCRCIRTLAARIRDNSDHNTPNRRTTRVNPDVLSTCVEVARAYGLGFVDFSDVPQSLLMEGDICCLIVTPPSDDETMHDVKDVYMRGAIPVLKIACRAYAASKELPVHELAIVGAADIVRRVVSNDVLRASDAITNDGLLQLTENVMRTAIEVWRTCARDTHWISETVMHTTLPRGPALCRIRDSVALLLHVVYSRAECIMDVADPHVLGSFASTLRKLMLFLTRGLAAASVRMSVETLTTWCGIVSVLRPLLVTTALIRHFKMPLSGQNVTLCVDIMFGASALLSTILETLLPRPMVVPLEAPDREGTSRNCMRISVVQACRSWCNAVVALFIRRRDLLETAQLCDVAATLRALAWSAMVDVRMFQDQSLSFQSFVVWIAAEIVVSDNIRVRAVLDPERVLVRAARSVLRHTGYNTHTDECQRLKSAVCKCVQEMTRDDESDALHYCDRLLHDLHRGTPFSPTTTKMNAAPSTSRHKTISASTTATRGD